MLKLNFSLKESYLTISTNISLEPDKIYAVVGPSGAGKSTFLNLISGFASISRGTIIWNGQEISNLPPAKRNVSILFQDNNLFPHLSVWRNLALAVTHWPKISRDNEEKLKAVMSEVGILGLENRKPSQLSGGQQSRVALARVLLQKNKILLLDEPFSALDPLIRRQMQDEFMKIQSVLNKSIVFITTFLFLNLPIIIVSPTLRLSLSAILIGLRFSSVEIFNTAISAFLSIPIMFAG